MRLLAVEDKNGGKVLITMLTLETVLPVSLSVLAVRAGTLTMTLILLKSQNSLDEDETISEKRKCLSWKRIWCFLNRYFEAQIDVPWE